MKVTRIEEANTYQADKHRGGHLLRLQGFEASESINFWVGLSHFLPGGGAEHSATPLEKVYVVLEGEVTITTDDGDTILEPLDSCYLAPNEGRSVENRTNLPASMLVIMPYPENVKR